MTLNHSRRVGRTAFTLVELLVVIAIIAVLVSLTAAAVMQVLKKIPEVQTRTDIGQLEAGLGDFMGDYQLQNPPPSILSIHEDGSYNLSKPLDAATVKFFQQWFGKNFNWKGSYDWNGDGNTKESYILQGQQCLVFYLGGIPTYTTSGTIGMTGFSPNTLNPAAPAASGSTRKGPYFNFNPTRLVRSGSFPVYVDAYKTNQAYAFFSSRGKVNGYSVGDCGGVAYPYYEPTAAKTANYTNNNRYQIISAGRDGIFGGQVTHTAFGFPWNPVSGATGHGNDDQANFSSLILGAGMQ